jgi:hypothetical protein
MFGEVAAGYIPDHPGRVTLTVNGRGATFTKAPCGCILRIGLTESRRLDYDDFTERTEEETMSASHTELLEGLLQAAEDGQDVNPADVAAAREAVTLAERRAAGKKAREEAAAERERVAALGALTVPLHARLDASQAELEAANTAAMVALTALAGAATAHQATVQDVANILASAGHDAHLPTEGHTHAIVVGDRTFPYFAPNSWVANIVGRIDQLIPLNRGGWSRDAVPRMIKGIPSP